MYINKDYRSQFSVRKSRLCYFQKLQFFSAQKIQLNSSQIDELKNRLLLSSKNPRFQNETRCTTFLVKMSFICMRMKNDFHIKGWATTLVLKQRSGGTRKWTIGSLKVSGVPNSIGCREVSMATPKRGEPLKWAPANRHGHTEIIQGK